MNAAHLKILTTALSTIRSLRQHIDDLGDDLQRAYDDQSGEWRFSIEGEAASGELTSLDTIVDSLGECEEELRRFMFLLSANPDFASVIGERWEIPPLPDQLPSEEEIRARPRRVGAPPYPFIKPFDDDR